MTATCKTDCFQTTCLTAGRCNHNSQLTNPRKSCKKSLWTGITPLTDSLTPLTGGFSAARTAQLFCSTASEIFRPLHNLRPRFLEDLTRLQLESALATAEQVTSVGNSVITSRTSHRAALSLVHWSHQELLSDGNRAGSHFCFWFQQVNPRLSNITGNTY